MIAQLGEAPPASLSRETASTTRIESRGTRRFTDGPSAHGWNLSPARTTSVKQYVARRELRGRRETSEGRCSWPQSGSCGVQATPGGADNNSGVAYISGGRGLPRRTKGASRKDARSLARKREVHSFRATYSAQCHDSPARMRALLRRKSSSTNLRLIGVPADSARARTTPKSRSSRCERIPR